MSVRKGIGALGCMLCVGSVVTGAHADEGSTAKRFETARADEPSLIAFLKAMPKGGDLHVHVGGATYAEYALDNAIRNKLYYDPPTNLFVGADGTQRVPAGELLDDKNTDFLNKFLDATSMRGLHPDRESGHDHFFDAFNYVGSAQAGRTDVDTSVELIARALSQKEQYLELMARVAGNDAGALLDNPPAVDNPVAALNTLEPLLQKFVEKARPYLDDKEAQITTRLNLKTPINSTQSPLTVRYIVAVSRLLPDADFFARLAAGMALMQADSRVVGVNILAPEDHPFARLHFDTQMRLLDVLWKHYKHPNITLHAGELTLAFSPYEPMRSRIRSSIEIGHARRIGHGVSIAWEDDLPGLFQEMRQQGVAVEICLTSNAGILGVEGDRHPFSLYRKAGIPLTLNTDDEAINRSNLTMEFTRAVRTYGLSYSEVKTLARNSIAYSFLSGDSLFLDAQCRKLRPEFTGITHPDWQPSAQAARLLTASEKMQVQVRLEQPFTDFENKPEE